MTHLYDTPRLAGFALLFAVCLGLMAAPAQAQELPLGSSLPSPGTLQNVEGGSTQLSGVTGRQGTVFIFWSNQCPWIDKYEDRVVSLAETYQDQGVSFVLINSNNETAFPKESAAESQSKASGYPMTYLRDDGSATAQAFGASRTPHVYVFDANSSLVYVGAIDDSPGDPSAVQKAYLDDALSALVGGGSVPVSQTKAFGCMIKE